MTGATVSTSVINGVCIHITRCSNESDSFIVSDPTSNDWAWITISRMHASVDSNIVQLAVVHLTKSTKKGIVTDSHSWISIAIAAALYTFFSTAGGQDFSHLEIFTDRQNLDSDWPTWHQDLMTSPILDGMVKGIQSIKFCVFTKYDGERGQSEEIYTINHPKGPNGMANIITVECTLMAEHIERLTDINALEIPAWTIILTKLHVLDPLAESSSLIDVNDEDTTPWTPLINALFSNPHITSLRIPGTLSKRLGELQYMWAIMTKRDLEYLDLGGEYEKWNGALELCKEHYQYSGRLV